MKGMVSVEQANKQESILENRRESDKELASIPVFEYLKISSRLPAVVDSQYATSHEITVRTAEFDHSQFYQPEAKLESQAQDLTSMHAVTSLIQA